METCSGRKNELTQCPRHADVFTYPRRPSVHTGHPAGTHTHPPTNVSWSSGVSVPRINLCDLMHVTTLVYLYSLHKLSQQTPRMHVASKSSSYLPPWKARVDNVRGWLSGPLRRHDVANARHDL